jgi:uncharacterized integral membrane protein (TIGR00697 family)
MTNELLFGAQAAFIGCTLLIALRMGKEALIAVIAAQAVLANLFVVKQISLLGFNATAADAYAVGCMLGLNLLQEYYGKAATRLAIWISFFVSVIFALSAYLHLLYTPFATDTTHGAYVTILSSTPRIVAASLFTYFIVQQFDMRLYGFLKNRFNDKFYIFRNYSSVALSQLLDTLLFSFLGLYGIVTHVWEIILVSYIIKLAILLLSTPFLIIARQCKSNIE